MTIVIKTGGDVEPLKVGLLKSIGRGFQHFFSRSGPVWCDCGGRFRCLGKSMTGHDYECTRCGEQLYESDY